MPDVVLSFKPRGYNRLDAMAMTSIHFGGTAFRRELEALAKRGGLIRIVILDPWVFDPDSPNTATFADLAAAFGKEPWELRAKCWYSTAVIVRLSQELGDSLQVRLIDEPLSQAEPPYFVPGRSSHAYLASDIEDRLDVIVPRIDPEEGVSSLVHPARVVIDRRENQEVRTFTDAFTEAWERGTAVDESLAEELVNHIYAAEIR